MSRAGNSGQFRYVEVEDEDEEEIGPTFLAIERTRPDCYWSAGPWGLKYTYRYTDFDIFFGFPRPPTIPAFKMALRRFLTSWANGEIRQPGVYPFTKGRKKRDASKHLRP